MSEDEATGEKISSREQTFTEVEACLGTYEIAEKETREAIKLVWEEKNRLFNALTGEERDKLRFHDEEHTNSVVSLTVRALIGAHSPKLAGFRDQLSSELVTSLIIDAIAHDWGYLEEQNGAVKVNYSPGHEDRSKSMLTNILKKTGLAPKAEQIPSYIDLTRPENKADINTHFFEHPELILRYADLCAGISFASPEEYKKAMEALWSEYKANNVPAPSASIQDLKDSMLKNGRNFVTEAVSEMDPFLRLLDQYYGEIDPSQINPVREAVTNNWAGPLYAFAKAKGVGK